LDPYAQLHTQRRRIYLMRHGSVDYFRADGSAVPPDGVALNPQGRAQADSAGDLFARADVNFDKVVVSGLPRTVETAERVLAARGQSVALQVEPRLQEIRPGRLSDIPRDQLAQAFLGAFAGGPQVETHRFLGGESVGELLDRVLPAFDDLLADTSWHEMLLVLRGVNLAPTQWLHERERHTTMEKLLAQFLRLR
jgi:broad specificity phosphatase PhoE